MSISRLFDLCAESYDKERRHLIPCYQDFYTTALNIIPFQEARELRVLDLGAGTGLMSAGVSERFPGCHLTLVDLSSKMLQQAEKRLEQYPGKGRHVFQVMNYGTEPLLGVYDLVISSLSIHHLSEAQKQSLFNKIFQHLEPGGLFINADQVLGENEIAQKMYEQMWLREVRASGIPETSLLAAMERMKEDKMSALSTQLSYLREAGFRDISTWYQYYSFVVYSGSKPLPR